MLPTTVIATVIAAVIGGALVAAPARATDGDAVRSPLPTIDGDLDDAALIEIWEDLDAETRDDVVEYLALDLSYAERFQLTLSRWVVSTSGIEPGLLEAAREPRWFDPQEHAPAQPIARRLLAADTNAVRRVRRTMAAAFADRPVEPAYVYDWGTGDVVRVGDPRDATHRFRAALAGLPEDFDLVEAFVTSWIDDGAQREVLDAFGHLYTDRNGRAYEGITLYEAWGSGTSIEMPDVDTLGLVHTLDDEWDRWVAPVPSSEHEALYGRIGDLFVPARHHRGLREAAASAYLVAEPAYKDGYTAGNTVGFHALWSRHSSDPRALGPTLPEAADWAEYLEDWNAQLEDDNELWASGLLRRDTLAADQAFVRHRLVAIMRDLELLPADPPREASGGTASGGFAPDGFTPDGREPLPRPADSPSRTNP